jgi:peptide/nickel transport system permease protein
MRVSEFLIIRLIMTIPTILLLASVVFFVMHVVPGDPVVSLMGSKPGTEEQIEVIRHSLGLDRPLHVQYLSYMSDLLKGDLGHSFTRGRPVIMEILAVFPATLELTLWSSLVSIPLGVYLGIVAAKREKKIMGHIIRLDALIRWCIPIFWFGTVLQILCVLYFPILPVYGRLDPRIILERITGLHLLDSIFTGNKEAFIDSLKHLVIPVFALGTTLAAPITRMARANIIDVMGEEYIKTARLKGLPEKRVFGKHALPNALIPILTYTGLQTAMLMGGAILTETTFSWPGLGRLMLWSVSIRDFNLIQGCAVFWALLISIINFIVDILYAIIDPRVRY